MYPLLSFPNDDICKTIVWDHNEDINIDRVKTQNISISTEWLIFPSDGHIHFSPNLTPYLTVSKH